MPRHVAPSSSLPPPPHSKSHARDSGAAQRVFQPLAHHPELELITTRLSVARGGQRTIPTEDDKAQRPILENGSTTTTRSHARNAFGDVDDSLPTDNDNGDSVVEYRVYNYRSLASGRTVRGDGWTLIDLVLLMTVVWMIYASVQRSLVQDRNALAWSSWPEQAEARNVSRPPCRRSFVADARPLRVQMVIAVC